MVLYHLSPQMEIAVCDALHVRPGHDVSRHAERDLRQEVAVELALAVDGDYISVLYLEDDSEDRPCG